MSGHSVIHVFAATSFIFNDRRIAYRTKLVEKVEIMGSGSQDIGMANFAGKLHRERQHNCWVSAPQWPR